MKILLIGHRGYLGRGLHAYLKSHHEVLGWDKEENLFHLDGTLLARENIELVINLSVAADRQSKTFIAGAATDEINVGGARHLVKILDGTDITWIQMSTREVLGPVYRPDDVVETTAGFRPRFLVGEQQPYAPQNFYGKSKIVAEFIAESYARSCIIRLTTCYTDFDHPGGNWMVHLVRSAVAGRPVQLTQGGRQFRDPLHIDDLGRLMELAHTHQVFRQTLHAGGGDENMISLREFVQRANPEVPIVDAPGGDYGFAFDNKKAASLAHWSPTVLVRERIPVLVENIRRNVTEPAPTACA